jgi:hypothetical protein
VGIEVDDVEPLGVGANHRVRDGVIAADDDGEGARVEDAADIARDVVEGLADVGVDDVGVATVDDPVVPPLVLEVATILVDVVVPELVLDRSVPRVLQRQLPDLAGREARARLPRGLLGLVMLSR